ncbi:hypothetical protein OAJ50_03490 [Candidatus Nitrosopelagicus sp.]|nr:hypothetical protein [Candidatus Nitrosopelagicus sp.]|tara:strand:- start:1126 stop:1989 length:864 start_codon:yes stop_codon:yes gene_type:complete
MKIVLFVIISTMIGIFSLNAYGDSTEKTNDLAYELMKNEDYIAAIEEYTKILKIDSENEKVLLNRAVAFAKIEDIESSLNDFSLVLEKNPENLTALKGKATILSGFECKSYTDCGPLQALQIFERMLEINPGNEDIEIKRNFMFTQMNKFNVNETNGEYIVNIQQIVKDKNGMLVSVIENARTTISPTKLMEVHLDEKEQNSINYKKEFVKIGENDYIKWHYETEMSSSEEIRKFFGMTKSHKIVKDGELDGKEMSLKIDLITALFPAINVDEGDSTWKITEVFKKI